jgi:hypothetical protein
MVPIVEADRNLSFWRAHAGSLPMSDLRQARLDEPQEHRVDREVPEVSQQNPDPRWTYGST